MPKAEDSKKDRVSSERSESLPDWKPMATVSPSSFPAIAVQLSMFFTKEEEEDDEEDDDEEDTERTEEGACLLATSSPLVVCQTCTTPLLEPEAIRG